jgi:hypothetical protein
VPADQSCAPGQVVTGIDAGGALVCAGSSTVLRATVRLDGTLLSGDAVDAERVEQGNFLVTFDRSLVGCAASVQTGEVGNNFIAANGWAFIDREPFGPEVVYVYLNDMQGDVVDTNFHLILAC